MLTEKQSIILQFVHKNGQITKQDAMELINTHYCNGEKHVGDCLSRMVNARLLKRIKPGVFVLGSGKKIVTEAVDENQLNLF